MGIFAQLSQEALDVLKAAGQAVETFVLGEAQKLVAEVKQTNLGTDALNIISALESSSSSGATKMSMVIAAVVPALTDLQKAGGLAGLVNSVEDFAREFCQSVYNDFKAAAGKALGAANG